jgi:hypothetical protein
MDRVSFLNGRGAVRRLVVRAVAAFALCGVAAASYAADLLAISGTPSVTANAGVAYAFTPTVSDPSGKPLKFSVANRPAWASFNASTGTLSGTPPSSAAGTWQADILISVTDGVASSYLPAFAIRVSGAPTGGGGGGGGGGTPSGTLTISGAPSTTAVAGQAYSFAPTVNNPGGTLKFSINNRPAWGSFNASTGALTGTPPSSAAGTWQADILISVTNGTANALLPAFTISVSAPSTSSPDKPVISGTPPTSATVGASYAFQPTARDPAGKALSFSVQNKPAWASFSIASGLLNGTPASSQTGTYGNIIITASNGTYSTALPAFNVTVSAAGSPPPAGAAQVKWVPPTQNTNGSALTDLAGVRIFYGNSASNLSNSVQVAGGSATTYTISGLPTGTWYFGAQAYTTTGTSSAMSSIVSKAIQ